MERFVFVAAVTAAIIAAIVLTFGGGDWSIEFDDDGELVGSAPLVELTAGQMPEQVYAADSLRVRYAAARIVITPEDRADFAISIDNPGGTPMPTVTVERGRVLIDGNLRGRIGDCQADGAELNGYEDVTREQMPLITIRAPRDLDLDFGGANFVEVGAGQSLDLDHSGCGQTIVGDIADNASIDLAGSGEVTIAAARSLDADIAGSGDLRTGAIAESATIDIAGSGSAVLSSLNGSLETDGAGSGNVSVLSGALTSANIDLAGSGDVEISAPVQTLEASIVGSGDVVVNGVVGSIDVEIAGPGGVRAQSVTGNVRQQVWGPGEVRIGS